MNTHRTVSLSDFCKPKTCLPEATFSFLWLKEKQILHFMDLIKAVWSLAISAQSFPPQVDQIPTAQA